MVEEIEDTKLLEVIGAVVLELGGGGRIVAEVTTTVEVVKNVDTTTDDALL